MTLTVTVILLAGVTMVALALVMSLVLGWANQVFHVEVDPRVESVLNALPGANCGGCGFVGCGEYAEAVVKGNGDVACTLCAPGGESCAIAIAGILGLEVEQSWPYRAVVHCAARLNHRKGRTDYLGEPTCAAANVISGYQGCTFGCMGLGDCVRSCDFGAIHIVDGLAVVDYDKCTGCGACIKACPRNIISRVPFKAERMLVVACSNKDTGIEVRKVCEVGCIGCKACTKISKILEVMDNLAKVDYDTYDPAVIDASEGDAAIAKCPMEALIYVGKPSAKDLAAVADEVLPDRIEDNFKTTADDADWRG